MDNSILAGKGKNGLPGNGTMLAQAVRPEAGVWCKDRSNRAASLVGEKGHG